MTWLCRAARIAPFSIFFVIFFSSSVLSEGGISWNFEAAEKSAARQEQASKIGKNNLTSVPAKSFNVGDLTTEEFKFDVRGDFTDLSLTSKTEAIELPTAEEQKQGVLSSNSTANGTAVSKPFASNKKIEPSDTTDASVLNLNGVDNAPKDIAAQNLSSTPDIPENSNASGIAALKSNAPLSSEQISLIMRSFDNQTLPAPRPPQPQVRAINDQGPKAILQPTNHTFDKIMVETLAVQDAVFEAEKGILSRRQDKKVVEGDYIPQVNAEVFGQYHIWDNYRNFDPLDEYDLSLTTDWKVYDFGRKKMKYESADLSIDISFNKLKTIHNNEVARLLKIYTDYAHQTEKMRLVEAYEGLLISLREEVEGRISGGVGTILEKNQFDQTLNSLRLRKLDASKLLQSAKTDYQLYFSAVFDETILPTLDEFQIRTETVLGGTFDIDEMSPLEEKLKLEIKKAALEKEISSSEYYPDIKVGLELKKYDLYDNDNKFEILGTLTSKMTLFDGFKRQYSVRSKGEEIAGLAAKLRLTKIQKEQRIKRYKIEFENLRNEIENEMIKIEKIQNDFDIAEDMTDLKALTFGERISFASDILTSQLRMLENYYQQYEILIDVLDLKGGFSDMFEIELASKRRTL